MATFETVAFIHIKDRKILLARSKGKKGFYMPGGKRNNDEDDIAALIREVKEELNVDINVDSIRLFGTSEGQAYGKPQGVTVKMYCYLADHKGEIAPTSEVEEIQFFSYKDYTQMEETAPPVVKLLEQLRKKNHFD